MNANIIENNNNNRPLLPYENLEIDQIISVDFGSFGFASAFCPVGVPSHLRMVQDWSGDRTAVDLNKNLAALLIDKETRQVVTSGFDAEEKYAMAQEKGEAEKYMFFQHVKPYLYSKDHLNKNVPIKAADGVSSLPLADLITFTFQAVMKHSLAYINNIRQLAGLDTLTPERAFWVITVPAIWDEMSKEMMKFCARRSGMVHHALGLEPIVSTFYVLNSQGTQFRLRKRNRLIVLDCGGGTIDAACVEITSEHNDLSELHHGDGILTGGLNVDEEFLRLMSGLFGEQIIDEIRAKQPAAWIRQRQEFVMAKFTVEYDLQSDDHWNVPLCWPINSYLQRMKRNHPKKLKKITKKISRYVVSDYIAMREDNYKVPSKNNRNNNAKEQKENPEPEIEIDPKYKVKGVFKLGRTNLRIFQKGWVHLHNEVLDKICSFLHGLFRDRQVAQVDDIILVGGFANSEYLLKRLAQDFPKKRFHRPRAPHLAVVKGALHWVCAPHRLSRTRAKYSYGIAIDRAFDQSVDQEERKKYDQNSGGYIVQNAFSTLLVRNEEYEDGAQQPFEFSIPANAQQIEICIYASEDEFCRYIYDLQSGDALCILIKKFVLKLDKPSPEQRPFTITLEYHHSGLILFYTDPNDQTVKNIEVVMNDVTKTKSNNNFNNGDVDDDKEDDNRNN